MKKLNPSQTSKKSTQKYPRLESIAKEMHKKFVESGRKPATDEEINDARETFYKDGKW